MYTKLTLTSQRSAYLCPLNARIKGICQHMWLSSQVLRHGIFWYHFPPQAHSVMWSWLMNWRHSSQPGLPTLFLNLLCKSLATPYGRHTLSFPAESPPPSFLLNCLCIPDTRTSFLPLAVWNVKLQYPVSPITIIKSLVHTYKRWIPFWHILGYL